MNEAFDTKEAYVTPQLAEIGKITEITLGGSGVAPDCGNDGFNNGKRPEHSASCP